MENDTIEKFRGPGFWESLREAFLGVRRRFSCLQVEVTSRCRARCTYCPHTTLRERWQSRDMAMRTFGRLWPAMRTADRVHLQGWGEPLMHPSFFEMVVLARKAGCAVSTTTCGLLMDENLARRIVDSGIDIIAFSLAGTDAATNAVREGADFDRVCRSIATLQKIRRARGGVHLEVHFAYLMLASAMEAVRGLPALAKALGVHAAIVSTLDYIPAPGFEEEAFGIHETEKLAEAATVLRETEAEARSLDVEFHWSLPRPDAPGTGCRENIARSFYTASDGAVSPCVYVNLPTAIDHANRHVFGNVNERDVLEIWDDEKFRIFRERLACGDPAPVCRVCPKRVMG
jgi:MoaA/NifB/PqqE/SkfB family radical SAM enzyme